VTLAIRTERLTKIYANRLVAVNDLNLEVPQGAIFGLLGPNGAGKTTTLRLLLGLHRPTAGRSEVFGTPCGANRVAVRRKIGYLPTNPKLPGHLRPVEYLDLLGQLSGMSRQERRPRLASLLRAVGLLGATNQRIRTFSTGMNTRLGIAASLISDPPLLIWDEPTAGLDPSARRFTLDLIRDLGRTRTIVVATHILSDIDQVCTHAGVMHEGRMVFNGSIRDMKRRLKRNAYRFDVEGSPEDLQQAAQQIERIDGVRAQLEAASILVVRLVDDVNRAATMAEVLRVVDANRLTLQAIRSDPNETENVYLQLLREDEAHGFQRFHLQGEDEHDAVSGHLSP
jgi:ABC-2 type transport system ATP-binding protein